MSIGCEGQTIAFSRLRRNRGKLRRDEFQDSCSASLEGDKERVTGDLCFDFHMKGSSKENIWEIYCPSPTSCKTTTLLSVPNPAEEAEVLADHFARPEQDPTSPSAHNRRHSESRGISLTSGVNLVMPLSLRMTSRWH